ncbi:MAG: DNA repair and recombination protein RadA [Candidatus Hodarchaeota archaeon]
MVELEGSPTPVDEDLESEIRETLDEGFLEELLLSSLENYEPILDTRIKKSDVTLENEINDAKLALKDIPGVGPIIAKKLAASGFSSARSIATLAPAQLQQEGGIGEKTAQKIILAAQELCKIDFRTATEIFERRQQLGRIVTGSNSLNELLGGGLEASSVTEFFGEYRTGKTQIAHQLCINVQLPEDQGGMNGKALYVDTEGTFRPERLAQMAIARNMDVRDTLNNVIYARAYNCAHQVNILKQARKLFEEQGVKFIVVDSIINHFRSEFSGLGTLAQRQQLLNVHLHQIVQLAETYSIAAMVTNQVQVKPDVFFGNPIRPAGGNILGHGSTYRLYLRKSNGDSRIARLVDAPELPEAEAVFRVTEAGIQDVH